MGETSLFLFLSGTSVLLISTFITTNRSESTSQRCALAFYWLSLVISGTAMLWVIADTLRPFPTNVLTLWCFRVLVYRAWLVIGVAMSCAVCLSVNNLANATPMSANKAARTFITSPYVLKAICFSASISFFCTEIGKLAHNAEMRHFFVQSGYPAWFVYFVIIAETTCAVGLFIPATIIPAALGLSLIMLGAIGTHLHNHDPFSDSLEALHLLLLLASLLVISLGQGSTEKEPAATFNRALRD